MTESPVHLVLILGAGEFPGLPKLGRSEAFRNSAEDIAAYFSGQPGRGVYHVKNLFDSEECVAELGYAIGDFLKEHEATATDLIIYYIGHGGFLSQRDYYLTLRSTRAEFEELGGLRVSALAQVVKRYFGKRVYVILDCCFAGEALREFQTDDPGDLIETKVSAVFPSSGTALLAASSKDDVALSPNGSRYTMFSGAVLKVLRCGIEKKGPLLSLEMVGERVRQLIADQHGGSGTLPEVHSPKQEDGQPVSRYKLFRNAAYAEAALPDYYVALMRQQLPKGRIAGVEQLEAELLAGTEDGLEAVAVAELRRVAEADDSNRVRERAKQALTALGVGESPAGEVPSGQRDPEVVGSLAVVVKPHKGRVAPHTEVIWTVAVTNDGQEPVEVIEVTDASGTQLCGPFALVPDEERQIEFRNHYGDRGGKVTIAVRGKTSNSALVSATATGRVRVRQPKPVSAKPKPESPKTKPVPPKTKSASTPEVLDLTRFRAGLREVKQTAELGDAAVNRLIRLISEGERHFRIATGRTAVPADWPRRVADWGAEVATECSFEVIPVHRGLPSPGEIVEYLGRVAAEVAAATDVCIPTDEFPTAPARSVNDAL
ncbi:caspase family protein [Lentzea sp. JNUCC 0626]|uniref:caspase family protein n=1 Tax=Lentzea sp. JNUCC 0626 TaxID=3367513 RepID=UPI0037482C61